MTTQGCDVASYQGRIDFDQLKDEVSFVFAKATEGTGYRDPTFDRNWTETKRVGLIRGAYHFARPDLGLTADAEAAYFLGNLGVLSADDLLALDYEVQWGGDVVGWCGAFLNEVRLATGITPYVYLNLALVRGHDWTPVIVAGFPLWLAFYDFKPEVVPKTPWPSVAIKQWTSSGTLAGISGRVDVNTRFDVEDDMTPEEAKQIAEKAIADAGLDPHTVDVIKHKIDGHIHAVVPNENQTTTPLFPPITGAKYAGMSADGKQVFWIYPGETTPRP